MKNASLTRTLIATVDQSDHLTLDIPGLPAGAKVRVHVEVLDPAVESELEKMDKLGLRAWFASLPKSTRTPQEWDEYDRWLRAERDSWDRD